MEKRARKNRRVMIVEDDSFVMDIYQTKLGEEGYDIMAASNGTEGLRKLEENKDSLPNLILLDIVMPYMDGLEFLREIKINDNFKNIPVILLTNLSQKEDVDMGLGLGANDYLIKSQFTPSEVFEKIEAFFNKIDNKNKK